MTKFKHITLFFLALSFLAVGFSTTVNAQNLAQDKVSKPWIFNYNFKEALYKTDMSFYGRDLSGLMFVKKTDKSYHVVLLSELGLKYLDIELFTEMGDISINYCVDFLSNKKILNSFEKLFQILFVVFPEIKKDFTFQCSGSGNMIRVVKSDNMKLSYRYYLHSGNVYEILHHRFLIKTNSISMPEYGINSPTEINFQDGKIQMHLRQVEK